jgi:LCP family protein required for cell wall assembly
MGAPAVGGPPSPLTQAEDRGARAGPTGPGQAPGPLTSPEGPPLFAVFAFWAFVLGGLAFGGLFLANWRALGERPHTVVAGPVSVPIRLPAPPAVSGPAHAPELSSSIANVVKNVLPEWAGKERIHLLLLGIDKREDEPIAGTRSDTVMLASIDPVTKSVALVSIPRDLWVKIPGCTTNQGCVGGQQRINVAHAVGGPELAKRTIAGDFGVPVDYYARVDFHGFQKLVDLIGGVIVDIEAPVKDDEYPTEDYGYQRIYFAPGPQLLSGSTALQYARSRHGASDFARARRQQQVLVSLRDRALQLNMLPKAPQMISIVQQSLSTDLAPIQLLSLARLLSEIDHDKIFPLVLDTNYVQGFRGADGADLLRADPGVIRRAIESAERAAAHPELRARIEILNGTRRTGLGQQAADYLTAQGFNVVHIAPAERTDYPSSLVQVLTDDRRAAEALASALRMSVAAISDLPTPNAGADIRVVLGQDFFLPGGQPVDVTSPSGASPAGAGGSIGRP